MAYWSSKCILCLEFLIGQNLHSKFILEQDYIHKIFGPFLFWCIDAFHIFLESNRTMDMDFFEVLQLTWVYFEAPWGQRKRLELSFSKF